MNGVVTTGTQMENGASRERCNILVIRYQAIIMSVYFFLQLLRVLVTENFITFLGSLVFFIFYGVLTYLSYRIDARKLIQIYSAQLVVFVIANHVFWGSDSGGQYFLYVMMISVLIISRIRIRYKVAIAFAVSFAYDVLYYLSRNKESMFEGGNLELAFYKVLDCVAIFALTLACLWVLLEYVGELEEKLHVTSGKLVRFGTEDPHTGLYNRRYMMEYMAALKQDEDKKFSIAIGDVDFFAKINGQNGFECGDLIIKQLAYQVLIAMDGKGRVARWGGEEFLFVFEDISCEDAYYYLTRLQQQIRNMEIAWNDDKIKLSMTFGLMECDPEMNLDYCLSETCKKMEMGKVSGRNTIIY